MVCPEGANKVQTCPTPSSDIRLEAELADMAG
jgi:hypothetical protein